MSRVAVEIPLTGTDPGGGGVEKVASPPPPSSHTHFYFTMPSDIVASIHKLILGVPEHPVLCDCTRNSYFVNSVLQQHGMLNAPEIKADTN